MSAFEGILTLTLMLIGIRFYYSYKQGKELTKDLLIEKDDREAEKSEAYLKFLQKQVREATERRKRAEENYSKLDDPSKPDKPS